LAFAIDEHVNGDYIFIFAANLQMDNQATPNSQIENSELKLSDRQQDSCATGDDITSQSFNDKLLKRIQLISELNNKDQKEDDVSEELSNLRDTTNFAIFTLMKLKASSN